MGFPSVFLFCTEKSHGLYGEKRKLRPYMETKLQFLHGLYGGKRFSKIFCAILTKSMEFLSSLVFHTVLWTTVFHPILLFLLNKALLVIVWNNLDSNCGILTRIETPLNFDSIGQKILENNFLHLNHIKILVSSLYRDEILFSIKIHGFSKCLSVLYKKIT